MVQQAALVFKTKIKGKEWRSKLLCLMGVGGSICKISATNQGFG